ncbi:MAG: nucleotidyltransferase domain-containing protein [Candidatus Rokubacteria bacterium]|nr:nucleotidyltransferase domain-containing protein [Candidatus Rokubacteria bacterium]
MAYSRDDALRIAREFLEGAVRRHRIKLAFLFGSHAWARPSEHSDIDLAVVFEPVTPTHDAEYDEQFEIFHEAQKFNSALEVVCFTPEEFESDGGALIRRIKKEGLEVWRAAPM